MRADPEPHPSRRGLLIGSGAALIGAGATILVARQKAMAETAAPRADASAASRPSLEPRVG